jgi:hypothetical protein
LAKGLSRGLTERLVKRSVVGAFSSESLPRARCAADAG